MEWERIITHLGMGVLGALVTLGGAIVAAWRKNRESELDAGATIREELREELRETREELRETRRQLREVHEERLKLKRALDRRDHKIAQLELRIERLEGETCDR